MPNEYMTPEIGKVIPMLTQTCDELTRQALIRALTQKTQEWVEGDPELADILLEKKKTLEECVRYVIEKAAFVAAKNINAMRGAELEALPKAQIHGQEATMAGAAVSDEEVYKWALEYYYDPDAKPIDFIKEAERKAEAAKKAAEDAKKKADAAKKKAGAAKKDAAKKPDKKDGDGTETGAEQPADTSKGAPKDKNAMDGGEQISMFGSPQAADKAA